MALLKKDLDLFEKVLGRATKMICTLKDESYEERLKSFKLTILETRRLKGDLIEAFNILYAI